MLDTSKLNTLIAELPRATGSEKNTSMLWNSADFELTRKLSGSVSQETPAEIERLKYALEYLDASCSREEWRNIVWGIISSDWSCAESVAREWSQKSDKFDETEFAKVVRSYDPAHKNQITLGSVYHAATQKGWQAQQKTLATQTSETVGDIKNAMLFCEMFKGHLLYVVDIGKWLLWRENIGWEWSEKNEPMQCAVRVAKKLILEAAAMYSVNQTQAKNDMAHAQKAHYVPRLEAMVTLAATMPEMLTTIRNLDSDPWLLGVRNGVVDLKTGQLLANTQEMLITRFCAAEFNLNVKCPKWLKFLNDIFEGDTATIESVQRLLGYTLTGLNTEEVMIFCIGIGANGKSVFGNVISTICDTYGRTAPPSLLVARRNDDTSPRTDIAALAGTRYVSINELQGGDRLDEQVVKLLAGRERISARYLYKEYFEFKPQFTCWVRSNHKPIITGTDNGIWRRLVLLPFNHKFAPSEQNPNLEQELLEERDGILSWIIQGTLMWQKDGLKLSPTIIANTS